VQVQVQVQMQTNIALTYTIGMWLACTDRDRQAAF